MDYILFVILSTGEIALRCPCEREQAQAGNSQRRPANGVSSPLLLPILPPERRNALFHDYQMKCMA